MQRHFYNEGIAQFAELKVALMGSEHRFNGKYNDTKIETAEHRFNGKYNDTKIETKTGVRRHSDCMLKRPIWLLLQSNVQRAASNISAGILKWRCTLDLRVSDLRRMITERFRL